MSLLRIVLSGTAQRAYQQTLPALCTAAAASSSAAAAAAAAGQPQGAAAATARLSAGQARQLLGSSSSSRGFHSGSAVLSSDQDLSQILAQELKHEQVAYEQDEAVAAGPPAPFKLSTTPGDTAVSLTREYKGETVSVDSSVNMQDTLAVPFESDGEGGDDDGVEDEDDEPNDVNFNVSVTKGGKTLLFECISDGTYIDIRHVSFEPSTGVESEVAYTGPVFGELDDAMQAAFRAYIAERGINEDMGEYLRHLLYDKEQQEYMRWLEGVNGFVKGEVTGGSSSSSS